MSKLAINCIKSAALGLIAGIALARLAIFCFERGEESVTHSQLHQQGLECLRASGGEP
jgi:hypothetical protein